MRSRTIDTLIDTDTDLTSELLVHTVDVDLVVQSLLAIILHYIIQMSLVVVKLRKYRDRCSTSRGQVLDI